MAVPKVMHLMRFTPDSLQPRSNSWQRNDFDIPLKILSSGSIFSINSTYSLISSHRNSDMAIFLYDFFVFGGPTIASPSFLERLLSMVRMRFSKSKSAGVSARSSPSRMPVQNRRSNA